MHRSACAGQALPGFRAVVHALDANEREEELLLQERQRGETRVAEEAAKTEQQRARAEATEAEAAALKAQLQVALSRAERAEAAAKSMEAAYDVMAEAVEDGKKREAALRTRVEAAEGALSGAVSRAERAEAAAKSMEAAYDGAPADLDLVTSGMSPRLASVLLGSTALTRTWPDWHPSAQWSPKLWRTPRSVSLD